MSVTRGLTTVRHGYAIGRDREVVHVAGVWSLRVLQPMLLAITVHKSRPSVFPHLDGASGATGRDAAQIEHLFVVMAVGALIVSAAVVAIAVYVIRVREPQRHGGRPGSSRTVAPPVTPFDSASRADRTSEKHSVLVLGPRTAWIVHSKRFMTSEPHPPEPQPDPEPLPAPTPFPEPSPDPPPTNPIPPEVPGSTRSHATYA